MKPVDLPEHHYINLVNGAKYQSTQTFVEHLQAIIEPENVCYDAASAETIASQSHVLLGGLKRLISIPHAQ